MGDKPKLQAFEETKLLQNWQIKAVPYQPNFSHVRVE